MRRTLPLALLVLAILPLAFLQLRGHDPVASPVTDPEIRAILDKGSPGKGADQLEWLYTVANFPYGALLPEGVWQEMLNDQAQTPDESQYDPGPQRRLALDDWEFVGPQGMPVRGKSETYSGRITDLGWKATTGVRAASANGGLWQFDSGVPFPLSDQLTSLAVGSFATHPAADGWILLGTGDPYIRIGTGMWRTIDSGASWFPVSMTPSPATFYRIRFSPWKTNEVHAATSHGHYRSDDTGVTWTRKRAGDCSDLDFDPATLGVAYTAIAGKGIYKTVNSGEVWTKLTGTDMPDSNLIGRTSLAVAPSDPQQVWALIAAVPKPRDFTHLLKSNDAGATWTEMPFPDDFPLGQGWYNHILSVHPTNPDVVLLGGVQLWRTTNGGDDWNRVTGIHDDQHAIVWSDDGSTLWVGNDGGLYQSTNNGASFTTPYNVLPITQYEAIDVCSLDPDVVIGGTQDNGYNHSTDLVSWEVSLAGDAGGAALKPGVCGTSWVGVGAYDGPKTWKRFRSTDSFGSYDEVESGIPANGTWYPDIRVEPVSGTLYSHADENVLVTTNDGANWNLLNPTPFDDNVASVTAERGTYGAVYATTTAEIIGSRVHVFKDGVWTNRDAGLPLTGLIRRVEPHPTIAGTAYLMVSNLDSTDPSPRIYITPDWGATWIPTTGSLGRIAPLAITSHPEDPNQIFLSTTTGMRWTPNGGTSWFTWSAGMPAALDIFDMKWTRVPGGAPGEWWLYGGSFGRGIWRRKVGGAGATGPVSASLSVVSAPTRQIFAQPDGSGATLADLGATIEVQVLDVNSVPVPGIPASQIWLRPVSATDFSWCTLPYRADGPTDFSGRTTFSGALPASGRTPRLQVVVNGLTLTDDVDYDIRSTDINRDFVVDLLDLVNYEQDRDIWFDTGFASPHSDLDFDGDVDLGDKLRLALAINAPTYCSTSGIVLNPPQAELGVWFDLAGTQFGQLVQTGDEFEFYVIAKGLPEGVRGIEFSLPALLDPAIHLLGASFLVFPSTVDERTGPGEYRFLLPDDDCLPHAELPLMKFRARLDAPVDELRICPAPASPTSFLDSGVPGWITCDDPGERTPFASVSCGVVNPFGSAIWSGLLVEAFSPGVITFLPDRIDLGGLGGAAAGMRIDLTGAGPSAIPRGLSDFAGVDGLGIQFLSTLPAVNLAAGATVEIRANGQGEVPRAGILGTADGNGGLFAFEFVGDPALRGTDLRLRLQGQDLLTLSGFDRDWKASDGVPSTFAILHVAGELVLQQEWSNPVTLQVDGQDYLVDEMRLTTVTGGTVPTGQFWSAFVGGSQIPNLQIGWQGIERFGQGYLFAQNVYLKSLENRVEVVRMDWSKAGAIQIQSVEDQPVSMNYGAPSPVAYPDAILSMSFQGDGNESLDWMVSNAGGGVHISLDDTGIGDPGWQARGLLQGNQQWEYEGTGSDVIDIALPVIVTTLTIDRVIARPMMATGGTAPTEVGGGPLTEIDELQVLFPNAQVLPDGRAVQFSFEGVPVVPFFGAPVLTSSPADAAPVRTALLPNRPNPFNPRTELHYELAQSGPVRLRIYDSRGRLVRTLVDGYRDAGVWHEEWSGRDDSGRSVASGIYHVLLVTDASTSTRKITLVK